MTSAPELGQATDVLFQEKPLGWTWVIFLVLTGVCGAIAYAAMPPKSGAMWTAAIFFSLATLICAGLAVYGLITRNDSRTFYGDRVETFRKGALLHTLAYTDVEEVAYGFRDETDQFLNFSGAGGKPWIALTFNSPSENPQPTDLTADKLVALRDRLNDIVADRFIRQASGDQPLEWFGHLYITRAGLRSGETLAPWSEVEVDANESNGVIKVLQQGRSLGTATMIGGNVVAGMIAVERLKNL